MGPAHVLRLTPPLVAGLATLLLLAARPAPAADVDPISDYCVADLSVASILPTGLPCKSPASLTPADFTSAAFRGVGNTSNPLGIAARLAAAASTFPALNTQGLALLRVDYASTGGLVPPHVHPRASEFFHVLQGGIVVGFLDSAGTLFSATLYAGELFVFPRGLVHFHFSLTSSDPAISFSSFNSQNPGLSLVAPALFASTPGIPSAVLERSFGIADSQIRLMMTALNEH